MKNIFYLFFAFIYYIYSIFSIDESKVVFIKTHDRNLDGNIGYIYKWLEEKNPYLKKKFLVKKDYNIEKSFKGIVRLINFFFVKTFHIATAKYIFLDNVFLPLAYIRFRKNVSVIQLWHGTGTIKKFGQDVNEGKLGLLEKQANKAYTHLIVNSESIAEIYSSSFGISKEKIFILGSPRTDFFFDERLMNSRREQFYNEYPEMKEKKIILYAPTFRDDETDKQKIYLELNDMQKDLKEEYILLLRLHPFVSGNFILESSLDGFVFDFSDFKDLNTLLLATDILITDYSSIIFEYSLLKRPMIFYSYDLEKYENEIRGFYNSYESFVPGPIVYTTKELLKTINNNDYETNKINAFVEKHYRYMDGKSTKRVIEEIFGN